MSGPLYWRDAVRDDRAVLPSFTCTDPPDKPREGHPREWEREVQGYFRSRRPPAGRQARLLLGLDGQAIVAASWFEPDVEPNAGFIKAAAIACTHQGMGYGLETVERSLLELRSAPWFEAEEHVFVWCKVHEWNDRCRAMLDQIGFAPLETREGEYEHWAIELPPVVD